MAATSMNLARQVEKLRHSRIGAANAPILKDVDRKVKGCNNAAF